MMDNVSIDKGKFLEYVKLCYGTELNLSQKIIFDALLSGKKIQHTRNIPSHLYGNTPSVFFIDESIGG